MKNNFIILAILLLSSLSIQAQNQITTPSGQPLVIGNNGVMLSNLNSSSATSPSNGKVLSVDANGLLFLAPDETGSSSQWNASGSNINYLLGNVGIGTANPLQRLHVNGDINIPTESALRINNLPFIKTPGTGNTALGINAGNSISTGLNNVFVGHEAGSINNSGSSNVFIGYRSGYSNTTGANNVYIGNSTGFTATASIYNVMIGNGAGQYSTSSYNTSIGYQAGQYSSGTYNFYLGYESGKGSLEVPNAGSANVFLGYRTGLINTGSNNIFFGNQTGLNNTSGYRNIFIGTTAGNNNTTGYHNTMIGHNANVASGSLTNATAIGANSLVSQSNSIVLGSLGTRVSIGNTAPNSRLHVTSDGTIANGVRFENLPTVNGTVFPLYIDNNGNVMRASTPTSNARDSYANNSHWSITQDEKLINTNPGSVIIGNGIDNTPEGYKLYVSNGILTEKVKVAVKNTSDWSDHVFERGYNLLSIEEVESHILKNKHLPGIPSAKEIVLNGNDLHKTDTILLEKIEEIMLYIIELKKENKALENKILELQKAKEE